MKKATLTFFVVLFTTVLAHAQIYIGLTESQIKSRVKPIETVKAYTLPDGERSLSLEYKENSAFVRRYYMEKETGVCYLYVLEPKSKEALDEFIKFCGENYDETDKEHQWMTNVCLFYKDGHCAEDVNVRVQLRTVRATGTRMFYFFPVKQPTSRI